MVSTASSLAPSLRWGILATGWISQKFALDLLIAPSTRGVDDIASHKIAAVASRSVDSADSFVRKIWSEAGLPYDKEAENVKKLGSYEELYESDQIDVIYIGTPHSHHYRNAHDALSAGKSVVCEKPLTVNAAQAEVLVNLAKEKNVFLMEAVWTRMQPVAEEVQQIAKSGILGELRGVQAELCIDFEVENLDPSHRMVAPELAGGALLDLGSVRLILIGHMS
jgi:predicted dehydrogenase